ncbi:two-CW domain-containing protein [Marinifilum sp.]|uniref:two-CW domain-containing protein n=1 Tax=Marinifilum sp. TaxID=2033137 RepID=UPI003BAB3E8D
MSKLNCWEYFKCGREIGGENAKELGVCPASTSVANTGINNGINAGRSCWTVKGTLCNKGTQGDIDEKLLGCINCSFFKMVNNEEGRTFVVLDEAVLKKDK